MLYGTLGQYTSLLYNLHVAPSITTQGRLFISSAGMFFEMFLANNVKFGSLNEVLTFIDNIVQEASNRKFKDKDFLDHDIDVEQAFAQIILTCGHRWIPNEDEMNIIWNVLLNMDQHNLNRIYYKNNIYEFLLNISIRKALSIILHKLNVPYLNPMKPPKEIELELDIFTDLLREFVYYKHSVIDRIDRMDNMVKSVCMISDTDSAIISLDPWYRFVIQEIIGDDDIKIMHQSINPLKWIGKDEFGDVENDDDISGIIEFEDELDFDFFNDKITQMKRLIDPLVQIPQDNTRYSIINIMTYALDKLVNDYILEVTKETNSYIGDDECKMYLKSEFLFKTALLTMAKKSYATLQEVQEGNMVPLEEQLDIKGIAALAKSSNAKSTRDQMNRILEEDILRSPEISQLQIIKKISILERKIIDSISSGSKEYYKPLIIKAASHYDDPLRIQGIKASMVWNDIKSSELPALDLNDRNSIDVAKITFNEKTIEKIKDINIEVYNNAKQLLMYKSKNDYKWKIPTEFNSIAIPKEINVPDWLMPLVDYRTIVNDGIGGFPLESVNIKRLEKSSINYSNIVKL